jgi:hypothetical protein
MSKCFPCETEGRTLRCLIVTREEYLGHYQQKRGKATGRVYGRRKAE